MRVHSLGRGEVAVIEYAEHRDDRGSFAEVYNKEALASLGVDVDIVQTNRARSLQRGTVRGMHYQAPPHAAAKLIEVTRGAILDVAVDIRHGSPTFGVAVCERLRAEDSRLLLVPVGFAHGYVTLTDQTEVRYGVTDYWHPDHEFGFRWDDPATTTAWPRFESGYVLSTRDRELPFLRDLPSHFTYA